jgi:hypothetical protein
LIDPEAVRAAIRPRVPVRFAGAFVAFVGARRRRGVPGSGSGGSSSGIPGSWGSSIDAAARAMVILPLSVSVPVCYRQAITLEAIMPRVPKPGQWVEVTLPDGTPAEVTTRVKQGRRLVVVRPLTEAGNGDTR